jgi:hypothetical protein
MISSPSRIIERIWAVISSGLSSTVTALDLLLPRLMADDPISREELALLGEGGLSPAPPAR